MTGSMGGIFKRLAERQLVAPYLENAFAADTWPETYTVVVDSSPYYGLIDTEGNTHEVGAGDGYFHPSTHPLMPARELYYRFHPAHANKVMPERRTFSNHMTLAVASALHATVQQQLDMAGILKSGSYEWEDVREGVRGRYVRRNKGEWEYINELRKCRGRADGILNHPAEGEMLFEFKTMNSRSYKYQDTAQESWEIQVNLAMDHYGVDEGVILLLELGWPWDMREFRVSRRQAILEPVYEKWEYVLECIKRDTPPPCVHALASGAAASCPVSHLCWKQES